MDSSNDSFAWTEASDSSDERDNMVVEVEHTNGDINESDDVREVNSDQVEKRTKVQSEKKSRRTNKISDRIQFEDEIEVNGHLSDSSEVTESKNIRRYLKSNPHLKPISIREVNSLISKDDDVWILKCPLGIDVTQLQNSDITIDEKCKMKIDSQTFHGNLNTDCNSVTILNYHKMNPVIKNVSIHGMVNFKKKIPRPHYFEDNVMVNNQTNFIPLPDTKCRHPLFGTDYKRAMKIPAAVKARFRAVELRDEELAEVQEVKSERKRKKKHKKEKTELDVVDTKAEVPRKKRKHLHTDEEEPAPKKSKKMKHDPDKVWESEEAIKESLFNF
ncbi:DNA-directed RNA polymerase I subunit RPA34-like [Hyposmocoma kahamanoa]|uniref:DNA-directed RNA polymerase I subunit RPA34-like n=1 Tax=Hyposmocoma kahamanoa TaxID=1477025 RepID=UPI000E6D7F16|nr:DNA-directed RNA polymerase I subunit RPA34-like [Hyposmocoma kahamanoa]